jgi:hypothetical protein
MAYLYSPVMSLQNLDYVPARRAKVILIASPVPVFGVLEM